MCLQKVGMSVFQDKKLVAQGLPARIEEGRLVSYNHPGQGFAQASQE